MTLDEIGILCGTDKSSNGHGYLDYYEKHIPRTVRTLLELGAEKGESLRMWDQYFGRDNISLHTLDLFLNPEFISDRWCRNRGIIAYKGDQSSISLLYTIKEIFDIIIDDASHRADHMLISFKHLFVNNCISGSKYFIEDLHANKNDFYYGGLVTEFSQTPLAMFKHYLETGKIVNPYFEHGEPETFESIIDSVEIYNDQIVMIKRK